MKDCFKPHRNLEAEIQLTAIIHKIQSLLNEPENHSNIEHLLQEAAEFIKAPDRVLDVTVIEQYEEWTDLEGLVGELTMEVPVLETVSKEDFLSIVQYIRDTVQTEQLPEHMRLDYWMNFYTEFFILNFPNMEADKLFDDIFEDTSLDELVQAAFPDRY